MLKAIEGDQTLRDTLKDRLAQSGDGPALFELEWWGIGVHSGGVDFSHLFKPKDRIPFRAADGIIYTWQFPLRDGAHAFDSNVGSPTLHIIHWPE